MLKVLFCSLVMASTVLAEPATRPSAEPVPRGNPTTKPTTLPSPAELVKRIKEQKKQKEALAKVAYIDLSGAVSEKPSEFSLLGGNDATTLRNLVSRLKQAKEDEDVKAVLITIGPGMSMNLSQAQHVRDTLIDLRKSDKKVFVYADSFDTIGYTVASGASDIALLSGGEIMIPGIGFETMFYKGAFDKVGVFADYVQIGEFKGADESYTRTEPSAELRGEMNKLSAAMFEEIVAGISTSRKVTPDVVKKMIDDTIISGQSAVERGFVDHLTDQDGLRDLLAKALGGEVELLKGYGTEEKPKLDFSNPFLLFTQLAGSHEEVSDKDSTVALIFAEGVISDGEGGGGFLGESGVGSEPMRRAFREALRDDKVKAVVIRIDSPGGSALASEVMWQAARRVAAKKPVIISVGSMAASGGYYLASAGDYIFADPVGIVGSIGVVGGKIVLKDLYGKLGLTTETYKQGRNAGLFSQNEPWTDAQRTMVRTWMTQTYEQFTQRVMTTRQGKIKDIDKVARGRIFTARQALELGMVDELGGTEAALAYAASKAGLKDGDYDVKVVPAPKTFADLLSGSSGPDALLPFRANITLSPDSVLGALSPQTREQIGLQLQFMRVMQNRPIALMSPYVMSVK